MRNSVIKNKVYEIFRIRKSVYSQYYDKEKIIFIHTPKTAGTSISHAIYGDDPWHYSCKELKWINKSKYLKYYKFGFVRNPWDRMFSTFYYGKNWAKIYPKTSIKFLSELDSFEEFIMNHMNEKIVNNHYFFWPYYKYLTSESGKIEVDFIGKFENLENDIRQVQADCGKHFTLPHLNKGTDVNNFREGFSQPMIDKIGSLYALDIQNFGYEFI